MQEESNKKKSKRSPEPDIFLYERKHYRGYKWKNISRLTLTYLAPWVLLMIFFFYQYDAITTEGKNLHLRAIAENQANTLNLFLAERLVNLTNLIDDPRFEFPPRRESMPIYLERLKRSSEAFVDIGYFDPRGIQIEYAGPFPSLENRNYSNEAWYETLKTGKERFVITDIYLGFRQTPHFTLAVSKMIGDQFVVLRATLSPEEMYKYISSLEGAGEAYTSIVNRNGFYQLVTPHIGTLLESSSIVPPHSPPLGIQKVTIGKKKITYAYSWLKIADWALITQWAGEGRSNLFSGLPLKMIGLTGLVLLIGVSIILFRAEKLVDIKMEADRTKAQLEHAAKLASIGELAAGIAHEINNPLAIISEEAGLIKDLMSAEYGPPAEFKVLATHLDTIHESVFRCRDITHKLLAFVRKSEMNLELHDVRTLIDGVVDGILGREIEVSGISIVRKYDPDTPKIKTDANQLQQVLLNIINNACDAITERPGTITITTSYDEKSVSIAIADSGKGMSREELEKIFIPFYTTKEVGKGTGLGLSVSYGIIKNLGGQIKVKSKPGQGSEFTLVLPLG